MACAAMLLAAFAPLILLKHAPVIPGTSTSREADGVTGGGAARAGRDVGTAARGARQAGRGANKLSALAAGTGRGRAVRGPVVGGGERPSRTPAPAPNPGRTAGSSAGSGTGAAGVGGSGTTRAGRPNPNSSSGGDRAGPGRHRIPVRTGKRVARYRQQPAGAVPPGPARRAGPPIGVRRTRTGTPGRHVDGGHRGVVGEPGGGWYRRGGVLAGRGVDGADPGQGAGGLAREVGPVGRRPGRAPGPVRSRPGSARRG